MQENNTYTTEKQLSLGLVVTVVLDVVKRWRVLVASALITAMIAFVVTDMTYQPVYRATTTLVATAANANSTTYSNMTAAGTAASLFTQVLNSSILRQVVLKDTGIPSFDGSISAVVTEGTNILTMTVTGSDPREVFLVSKAVIDHHHVVSDAVMNNTIIEVLKAPSVPVNPVNTPNVKSIVARASMVACAAVAVLIAVLSVTADKVRSKEEADAKLSCYVLGELYHERKFKTVKSLIFKRKTSIVITNPLTSFLYTESVNKLATRVDKRRHKGEKIVMVTSFMENEGKSTVSVNLALALAQKGKSVLLIDCDLRKPACIRVLGGTIQAASILDVLYGKLKMTDCIRHLKKSGLDFLPGSKNLKMTMNLINSEAMENLLKEAAEKYDIVILDTPPMGVAPDSEVISSYADAAVMVVRQNAATAGDLNDAAAILNKNTHLLGCVLNNVHGSGDFAPVFRYGGNGDYGKYGRYGRYGQYGQYGNDPQK